MILSLRQVMVALLLATLLPLSAHGENRQYDISLFVESPAVARRGDVVISLADVQAYFERRVQREDRTALLSNPARLEGLLENILLTKSFVQKLEDQGLLKDNVINARLQLAVALEARSIYRQYQRESIELESYESQARELYLTEPEKFMGPSTINFDHILVSVTPDQDDVQAMKKIVEAFERLSAGESFSDVASQFSDDPAFVNNKGRYIDIDPKSLLPSVSATVDVLDINQWSMPIQSRFGWHLVRITAKNEPDRISWDEAQPVAEQIARDNHLVNAYERTLREINSEPLQLGNGAVALILETFGLSGFGLPEPEESDDPETSN